MAFLHQLKLLLWKNGLAVIRQPLWSLTLIIWPLVIFIIVAVTRHQFPPIIKDACYVGPRNLPSAGFFPFLQTLMCNTDSNCHNTSRLADPAASKSSRKMSKRQRFSPEELLKSGALFNFNSTFDPKSAPAALVEVLSNIVGTSRERRAQKNTFMNINETLLEHNETLHTLLKSANKLKRAFCTIVLPMTDNNTDSPFSFALVTFCKSKETVFEVSLNTLNQALMQLMLSKPDEVATFAGMAVVLFEQLQNQTSLWENLLILPQLFSSGSVDDVLDRTEDLLTNIQGAMHAIKSQFPEADAPLSVVKPVLRVGLKLIDYAQNWPGKDVSIPLGEIVKLHNDSLSAMVKQVLHDVEIPLDKAIALTMESDMLHKYVCNNSANPLWLTAACRTGTVHTLLGWIDSDKTAKQVLLAWSKHVARHDISIAKWLLHSLMEGSIQEEPDSSQISRTRRSIETQPQNIEEELFLAVGEVILEIIQIVPDVDRLVHNMLRSGFQSMKIATLTVEIVDEIMASVLNDANQLQQTYLTLMTNQSEAGLWLDHVVDSVKELIMKTTSSKPPTCEEMFAPFEWLFSTQFVTVKVWRSLICESGSDLQQVLLLVMMPLVESAQDFNDTVMGNAIFNVSLPMILSEWQKLYNNSMQFGMLVDRLAAELGGEYWANWMPDSSTYHVTSSLQQSVFLVLVNVGGHIEKSELWHQVKDYFYMVNWVLNYKPDVTTLPPDCFVDISSSTVNCNTVTDFNWPHFVTSMTQSLMSPNQDVLVNVLKGTVNLLQHVYSDILKSVVGSFLKENIQNGDALSDFLINMVHHLQSFVKKITMLPDEDIADSKVMGFLVSDLLQSTGLTHLLPLLHNNGYINASTVLHVVTKLIRQNQHIFTFNETDPTMPQLERLIKHFLSIESNLTMSLSNIITHTVVTYAGYFNPDDVADFIKVIQPFTNQTSTGIVETILRAMELLKTVMEAPNGDPTNIILEYIRQLQDFIMSVFRLRRVQHSLLPNGELSAAQVTDLYLISKDFLKIFTPEGLQSLIDAGPDAAQDIIAQKLIAYLPAEVHQDAALLFRDFKALQHHLAKCATGQDCLNGISVIFTFLNQTLDMVHLANGNVNIKIALPNLFSMDQQHEEIASLMFPLLLSPNDAAYVKTFKQALHFIQLVMATPNITVFDVQQALQHSNLTLEELNNMVSLFGAANTTDLMSKVMDVINSQKCFEPQDNQMATAQCVAGYVNRVSGFLTHLPVLQNETAILSLIPLIINNTIRDVIHFDFSSNPHTAVMQTLNTTLANIKMGLQLNHWNTPEIMNEIKVLEGLIKLAANPEPLTNIFNSTLTENPMHAQKVYLEAVDWYLKRVENITRHSSLSELLFPIFYLTQMQVSVQLAQTDFTLFVSNQIEHLMNNIQHPIDGAGVSKIAQTAVEMFHRLFKLIKANLEFQNSFPGLEPFFDTTVLHAAELQIKQYLDITQNWIEQPNFPFLLTNMLLWQNSSISPQKCFEPQQNQIVTSQCVHGLINGVSSLLSQLPVLKNETAFLSLLPLIVNNTIRDVIHFDFSSNPHTAVMQILNTTLANIKMGLQLNHLNTPEIMNEIKVLEGLIKLAANPEPLTNIFNSTLTENPMHAQKVYLEAVDWYLKRVENITRHSSLSELLQPILYVTQRQVTVQLAQTDFTLFVSNQIEHLMNIQHPIDGAGVSKIAQTAVEMFHRLFKLIKENLEFQNDLSGLEPFLNTTVLHAAELQIRQYLDDIIQKWMNQPKVPLVLASMLQWGKPNITASIPLTDLHHLLQTVAPFLNTEQLGYHSIISNITQSLKNVLMVAEQPGGIQSDYFIDAILEAVQSSMQILSATTHLPLSHIEQNILEIVNQSLKLIVQPDMNFDSPRLMSLKILKNVELVIEQILPEIAEYLLPVIKVATTYFESSLMASGADSWNHIILNEMITVQSLLPPNSTAQAYVSTLINITHFILESGQGNMSLWAMFESASAENVPMIIGKMGKLLGILWPVIMGGPGSNMTAPSLEGFAHLGPILEQVMTGMAEQPGGIQSDYFIDVILEAVQSSMQILSATTHLPLSHIEQNILEIVNQSLKLIVQQDMNFDSPRLMSLKILKNVELVIKQSLPEIAEYLLPVIKVATTYFESSLMASGADSWNHIILNEMITVQSLLPPNSTAQAYVSTLINITHFILESGQGNMSLWAMFESASAENVPMIIGKMGKLLGILWPVIMGGPGSNMTAPSLEGFAHLGPILEQVMTGMAEQPGGIQSDYFIDVILEAVQSSMQILSATTHLPLSHIEQNILEIVNQSLKLIVQPDMNFDSSRLMSLKILKNVELVIEQILPEIAEYLLPVIKVVTTYFESSLMASGADSWNHIILNEMITVQSFLPPNSTAQAYVSTLINITHFILESGQGNMSLWAMFESASAENVPMIFGKMGKLLGILWPVIMGGPGSNMTAPSLEGFAHLGPILEQVMTGTADQVTWDKLENILEALLSPLEETELWESVLSVVPLFEKIVGSLVNNMKAENVMILSLQKPMMTLMKEFAHSVNSSHFNLTEATERMQVAIEHTVQAAQQANSTLECSDVLKAWDPVREAAGLSHATMAMWCNISLQPVLEAYMEALVFYSNLNMSHDTVEDMTVDTTAERIVETLQSVYQVSLNRTHVAQTLITTFSSHVSMLTGRPLSPEAELHWYKQFQDMQLLNSFSSLKMLTDQLLNIAPSLQPFIESLEEAQHHILENYHQILNSSSSEDIFKEAVMIFLNNSNMTSDDIFSMMMRNFSGFDEASLTDLMRQAVRHLMMMFEDVPEVYHGLERFLASDDTDLLIQKVAEMVAWLASTEEFGLDMLDETLAKISHIFRPLLSALTNMMMDMPANMGLFEDLAINIAAMVRQIVSTSGLLGPKAFHHGYIQQDMTGLNHTNGLRRKRDAPWMPVRSPMDDFIDLFYIDYHTMFKALSVVPTTEDIMETVHVFFANPDLGVVIRGVSSDMPWYLNVSREDTIDGTLGMLSFFTLPGMFEKSSMELLQNIADVLPDGFPFAVRLQKIIKALAHETQENLHLMENTFQTASELLQIDLTDSRFLEKLDNLTAQVCTVENTESVHMLMLTLGIERGQLCNTLMPTVEIMVKSLMMNSTSLSEALFEALVGDPSTYDVNFNWTSALTEGLNFNASSLSSLNINIRPLEEATFGEMMRNEAAFVEDVERHTDFDPASLQLLMNTTLPSNYLKILSWLVNLRHCNSKSSARLDEADGKLFEMFCSMPVDQWYSFSLLVARHLNVEKLIYRMVLSDEMQGLVGVMLQVAEILIGMMDKILPTVSQLESFLLSMEDLNLKDNEEFHEMTRGLRHNNVSPKATFVTLSRALCSKGVLALFGLAQLPLTTDDSSPSSPYDQKREEMIERFKIPRSASPFCMNMYLDMVNTTGGAIAWAFLKPMLMGQILFSPDTPITREIMEKANATLQELADLRKYSVEWIDSSNYIIKSAELLSHTLPILQNSLGNSFVKNFIEMQTDINVGKVEETLSNFSNMTLLLEKNKHMLKQITTMSTLMVNLSSCVKFDRYRGYNSVEELDAKAQELAKNRDLYASVIFKLPKDSNSSRKRRAASFTSSLPPKVSYTIRMHMDNVMRTDRVRYPYFTKETHINARMTLRYNRGFVYLQENIDRAIIAIQTGETVAEPAVQLQPFPYPCHLRDEYFEAISFVFPLMLMLAWVLFVADFVKKLVHERELRLHEYMKMMGVNPLSHFFAWFLECATYLAVTIIILTLILKFGNILPKSDGFLLFLFLCDYGLSVLAFSYLIGSFFDKTFIAGLSGSLLYILCFFPFIVVMAVETTLTFTQKSILSLFSPTCFSYASQYMSRYESQGEGIHWSNSYSSPIAEDTASFGWLCWLMLIDSLLYFFIGAYIRMVFPGKYGIPAPWYFPFKASFWTELCCCVKSNDKAGRGLLFSNIMQKKQPVFSDDKGKGQSTLHSQTGEDYSNLPVGVALHGLSKMYGDRVAIENLNVSFYEGHVTTLLGHNGAGKTTTMSLLTGLFAPTSGTIEVYGRDMQNNIDDVRRELGVCMQYDVLFDHMTTKEHLLLYGQIKAPHWSKGELHEQVRTILEETGMYAHRYKRVGTLSGGMKRKLSISIAFIGGSRLVVLDEPTTGVDPCSRRSIWDIVIQHKKQRTIIMSTHHLDEAEVLSDRITFLERGGLKCCGSPFHLKDKLGQGYKLTLTKKMQNLESERIDNVELKSFVQAHVPEARLKEAQGGDLVYSLPAFNSSNASSYRSLLTALDSNLDALQLSGYGISDTTLEEVFLQLGHENELEAEDCLPSISETVSDAASIDSFPSDLGGSTSSFSDNIKLTGSTTPRGMTLAWQQMAAMLTKRFHHSRRDWKGLIAQILLPVLFMVAAMGLGSIRSDLQHYPELELSPALYKFKPSYSFFSNSNPDSEQLINTMTSFPGIDNACLNEPNNPVCSSSTGLWRSSGNSSKAFSVCKCTRQEQTCESTYRPPHKRLPSSQILYNLSGINVENYLLSSTNDFIRNRYGGFDMGMPLPADLQMDVKTVPKNRTLSKVWFNPEGHHTMPAYLNSINNLILRSNLPADKDPRKYAISVSSHPYFGRADDEDAIIQGMLQILVAMCVLTGYSITTASFAIYVVGEHHSGSKRLQHIAGISEAFYWIVNFFYDMVIYLIPVTLTIGVIAAFQIPAFTDRQNLAAIALLLVLFGFATFPWMYLLSDVFKDAEVAFITYVCINLFISINTILSTSILYFLSQISTINPEIILVIFNRLCNTFLIFPQFNFGHGMMQLTRKNIEVQILSGYGIDAYQNPFSMEALGWMFISSFIQGVVLFSLRLLLNRFIIRKVRNLICRIKTVPHLAPEDEDEDVATEHLRVASGAASSDVLQVNQLTKVYQNFSNKVQAVKRVSVGIPAGECFGLLGVNGAGKTTTFKMLTGDVSPTDGTAQIRDRDGRLVDIMECRNQGINIGYCPQVDALDNLLTGEEHLYFYARIRGISRREIDRVVRYLLKRLELNNHRNITTEGYSCGTRRKLSTALALIGHPQILLLDEPSSGMDPRTKRHLWKIISEEVKGKCAVVLTSHSMEECEALCGRLAIMVKGQFRCLGSLQHIKNRFGSGFTVKMYLAEASCNTEAITGFMQRRFPSTYLKDQHSNMAEYHLPIAPGGVADIFDQLESNKNALQIKHFSVSQTTLDEVFINFAMEKTDMESILINDENDSDSDSLGSIKAADS